MPLIVADTQTTSSETPKYNGLAYHYVLEDTLILCKLWSENKSTHSLRKGILSINMRNIDYLHMKKFLVISFTE